ncbi:MAG: UbiX family flavin prenyltransferase [Desulfomonilaceae bacterium]
MKRIIVGISGASGTIYGIRLLEVLRQIGGIESHLILSRGARITMEHETSIPPDSVGQLADVCHSPENLAACLSSGSFRTDGMVVAPCSIKSLSMIANSIDDNLLVRAADVTLKERRKLVLIVRETPLHLGHLRHMTSVTEMGAIILPPVPSFYHSPKTIEDIIDQTIGKVLDQFDINHSLFQRWTGKSGWKNATKPGRLGRISCQRKE